MQTEDAAGRHLTLAIRGMHCTSCAQTLEKKLRALPGVLAAQVNFAVESHMDYVARELAIDAYEFRRMNVLKRGDPVRLAVLVLAVIGTVARLAKR